MRLCHQSECALVGQTSWHQLGASSEHCLRLKGHMGMRVSAPPHTPKLMHTLHNSAQSVVITVRVRALLLRLCIKGKAMQRQCLTLLALQPVVPLCMTLTVLAQVMILFGRGSTNMLGPVVTTASSQNVHQLYQDLTALKQQFSALQQAVAAHGIQF